MTERQGPTLRSKASPIGQYLDHVRYCFWQLTTHPGINGLRPKLGQQWAVLWLIVFYLLKLNQLQICVRPAWRKSPNSFLVISCLQAIP